ncbi:hypothetical protein ACXWPW_09900, partial [Streptococcus pyogenes]
MNLEDIAEALETTPEVIRGLIKDDIESEGWLQVSSYEEKREDLANEYDKEVKRLKKQFGRGE